MVDIIYIDLLHICACKASSAYYLLGAFAQTLRVFAHKIPVLHNQRFPARMSTFN